METALFHPLIVPAKTAVLLVFVPTVPTQPISQLLERVRAEVGDCVRITRVDQLMHPEVVRSFGVQQLPSFVLLKQGIEIWRHMGLLNSAELSRLLTERLQEAANW
ncbi:hypothetical protein GCM10027299_15290 [Larkinella ripae]